MTHANTILAAVDLDVGTSRVLQAAIEQCVATPGARLAVIVVDDLSRLPVSPLMPVLPERVAPEVAKARIVEALQAFERENAGVQLPPTEVHVVMGSPAEEIVWLAANLDASRVVIGSHGRRGLRRLLVGSVAERVVRLAGCPVFVVREIAHDPSAKVPEIEPLCDACAAARESTKGSKLWCERHADRHLKLHVYSYGARGENAPQAWSASTGT